MVTACPRASREPKVESTTIDHRWKLSEKAWTDSAVAQPSSSSYSPCAGGELARCRLKVRRGAMLQIAGMLENATNTRPTQLMSSDPVCTLIAPIFCQPPTELPVANHQK